MLERVGEDPRPWVVPMSWFCNKLVLPNAKSLQHGCQVYDVIGACLHVSLEKSDQPRCIDNLIFLLLGDKLKAEEVIRHTTVNLHHLKAIFLTKVYLQ